MKNFTKGILIIALLVGCALNSAPVMAQWNTNTSVNLQISGLIIADQVPVATSDGKTWIAFYVQNGGNYDMRAQLIDADGYKLLGPNGMLVSNKTSGTATYVFNACVDSSNNLIISMQDQRTGTLKAVLYKISETGTFLWSSDGVVLGEGLAPYSTALGNGEVVTAWNESTSNTLKMQKISASGTTVWATPVTVKVGAANTTRGQLIANLNNKFTMVYQKRGTGVSTTLYAQQFNSDGSSVYAPLLISNQTTAGYTYYSLTAEGDTTYFGYFSSVGFRFNSYLQRINPDGTIPWGMNGSNFNTSTGTNDNYQNTTNIAITPGSPYVWSVCSFCDPNQTNYGIYIQKYLKTTGARMLTNQGKVVYPVNATRNTQAGDLALVEDTPMFMFYDKDYKIYATRLDASGNFLWPNTRLEISSTTAGAGTPKGRYGFTPVGPDRCAGVWNETRNGSEYGYAQGVSVGGLIGLDVATQGGVPATITTPGGTLQLTAAVYPSTANQNVNWSIIHVTGTATISPTGLVTSVYNGVVWAKATAVQDNTVADSILITISGTVSVNSVPAENLMQINPSTSDGRFTIRLVSAEKMEGSLEIYTSTGIPVWKQERLLLDGSLSIPVELSNAPAGAYIIRFRNNFNSVSGKFSIIR